MTKTELDNEESCDKEHEKENCPSHDSEFDDELGVLDSLDVTVNEDGEVIHNLNGKENCINEDPQGSN